ncbi:recombinase [Alkalibaculum bacchi]|uniref:recombinase n=1 Tax=Alkalibaculum bacchi TaxID=645887 RepID=UPI0026EB6270|nr:recombinase [Alkalibaculum bacchi]
MGHTPYGYKIENGTAVVDQEKSEKIKLLFEAYLSGDSLATAAKKAGIKAFHAGIGNILKNKRYVGDDFYPAIIDKASFEASEIERMSRAEKLGRIWEKKEPKESAPPTVFSITAGNEQFDDPFKQAEYAYSLIEMEVKDIE